MALAASTAGIAGVGANRPENRRRGGSNPTQPHLTFDRATDPAQADAAADPEEHARSLAWRALNRRERTVDELGGMLLRKRVEPAVADRVVTELIELGYLDDARYAERFAEDRRRLDGWGSERIARRLRELGVGREHVDAALAAHDPEDEMAAALELLRRRCPDPPATRAERDRALGILVRRGYARDIAFDALRRHAGVEADPDL